MKQKPAKFTYTSPLTGKKKTGFVGEIVRYKSRLRPEDKAVDVLYMRSTEEILYPINDNLKIHE